LKKEKPYNFVGFWEQVIFVIDNLCRFNFLNKAMVKIVFLIQVCLLPILSYSMRINTKVDLQPKLANISIPCSNSQISLNILINLMSADYKKVIGEKLSVKETFGLMIIQAKLKKRLRKGGSGLNRYKPRKKPKLLIALLIVFGIAVLFLSLAFLFFSGVDW